MDSDGISIGVSGGSRIFVGLCMLGLAIIMASYCSGFAFNLTEVWLILVCGANWIVLVINLRLLLSE